MAVNEGDEATVSLVDVLEEDEELENEASAVLGGSDPEKCSYPEGYVKRQALYACNTCTPKGGEPAGICLACSYKCHEGHDLFELYTKRNFRCDCGNGKFKDFECKLYTDKDRLNTNNKYNHNFFGLYCTCERPYPDPEDQVPDEMIQCIVCEDWFHGRHLGSVPAESIELQEMVCGSCMDRAPFLWAYAAQLAAPSVTRLSPSKAEVDVEVDVEDGQHGEEKSPGCGEEAKQSVKKEAEQPCTSTACEEKAVANGETGCKRKYDEMEAAAECKTETAGCKLQELKAKGFVKKEGAIFWPYVWRSKLCTCTDCKKAYVKAEVPFLLDESDTVLAYEHKGKTEQESAAEGRDPLMTALSSMDRVQQLELIYGGEEEMDLVADLLAKPFWRRTFQEKLEIVRKGRPTPQLAALSQPGKGFVRHFQSSNYERYAWLTASKEHCKLYCWECLLFATDRYGAWSHAGFANLNCLTKAATRHQSTAGHLQATVLLKMFGDTRVDLQLNDQMRRERELHNEKVKKNREILKRLIDCVIFLGKQELSFRGHDESKESTDRGNYVELISFLAEHDNDLHYHLSTNEAFTGTSGKTQNDLISAIAEVMAEEIKREIDKAPFVAVMVDETTDVSTASQLALVLRYVTDTGVKERFVRFDDVTSGKRADDIAALVIRLLEEHECLDKVVAQCFDGAAVMASGLNEVQAKVKVRAPMALFIHCYAHRLNLVLTQGASKLRECRIFFARLNGLAAFLSRSPKCMQLLDNICQRRLPRVAPTRWQYSSRLVSTVFEKRVALKELFEHILEHHDEYDEESVRCADGYSAHLGDFEFCFLLSTFHGIFQYSDVLFGILQNKTLDVQFCLARLEEFCDTIERGRGQFGEIYESTVRETGTPSTRTGQAQGDIRARYQKLHSNILDNILAQIRNRFKDHEKVMFLSLLDPPQFQTYRKKFPDAAFSSLTQSHGTLFDLPRLKTELTVMYAMTHFEGKSPADLLAFLQQKDLCGSMRQLYALACLAVTIPVPTASVKGTFSALKRIQTYSRNETEQARLSALASMAIEKELLLELKRTGVLYNRVIELFVKKERRMDFVFK